MIADCFLSRLVFHNRLRHFHRKLTTKHLLFFHREEMGEDLRNVSLPFTGHMELRGKDFQSSATFTGTVGSIGHLRTFTGQ